MFVVKRSVFNPILSPVHEHPWEGFAAFNWCPVVSKKDKRTIHCVYRAMSEPDLVPASGPFISSIGHATSKDGIYYTKRTLLIKPEFQWERFGCEDPRVTELNGKYYIFYTALSLYPFRHDGIKVACAITRDFKTVEEKHLVTPFNAKAMALFPGKVNGKITAVLTANTDLASRRARIAYAQFDDEKDIWNHLYWKEWYKRIFKHTIRVRRSITDHVEVGSPPLKTKEGWLLLYAHIKDYLTDRKVFGIEAVLLDMDDPKKVIGRTRHPILIPEETYEKYGQVPNVIFPSGALIRDEDLWIFYGATDTTCCVAQVRLKGLLNSMIPARRHYNVNRARNNPIIEPIAEHSWESKATFNPAAVELDGKIHLVYRAMSQDNTSTMGYASTVDGLRIYERLPKPIYVPRIKYESKRVPNGNSGCEDPRIVRIGRTLYMCYTAYCGTEVPRVALTTISVKDFLHFNWDWSHPVLITPPGVDDKDACIWPEKIDGQFILIHRIKHQVCLDYINSLEYASEEVSRGIKLIGPRYGMWDSQKIGLAGPPIKTKAGWILFYHGIAEDCHYRLGAALLDLKNPMIVLSRTNDSILEPEKVYEKKGQVPDVVFPCGHVLRGDTVYHYYGGADSVVGVATMSLSGLLAMLK